MEKQLIVPEGTDAEKITIAPGVRIGNLLFLSGTAGYDRERGGLAGDDIESQSRQALKNLGVVLEAAGSSWDKVVKVTLQVGTRYSRSFSQLSLQRARR